MPRRHISLSEEADQKIRRLAYQRSLETGKTVYVSHLIEEAIELLIDYEKRGQVHARM